MTTADGTGRNEVVAARVGSTIPTGEMRRSTETAVKLPMPTVPYSLPETPVPPIPNGWYAIAGSADLEPGVVHPVIAVERELVVFRDEHGTARVFDAHCPHLGAHLGDGRVVGDSLKCPYHGWTYGPDGACTDIPYSSSRIPSKACVRSYPVREHNGFVMFWYHAGDAAPSYEVPTVDGLGSDEWSAAHPWRFELVASLQEMAENNVDYAHLKYVHRRAAVPAESSVFTTDGPFSTVEETLPEGTTFLRHAWGPGIAMLRMEGLMTLIAATTPIDRRTCRLLWHFHFPPEMEASAQDVIDGVTGEFGLLADVPIWANKVYRDRPVLVKEDAPIVEFRRWYAQFYEVDED